MHCARFCERACEEVQDDGSVRVTCPAPKLLPEAWPFVLAYQLVQTQWRHAGMGARSGLDYPACALVWGMHRKRLRLPADARLIEGIQIIEAALLRADSEERERERLRREQRAGEGN